MVLSLVVISDEEAAERVVGVEQWAELRREHFVGGKSIKELTRTTGGSSLTAHQDQLSSRPARDRPPPCRHGRRLAHAFLTCCRLQRAGPDTARLNQRQPDQPLPSPARPTDRAGMLARLLPIVPTQAAAMNLTKHY
jgi:hypothetical protein